MLVGRLATPVSVPAGRCPVHCQATLGQAPRPATSRSDASIRAETTRRIKTLGETGRARDAVSALAQMARLGVQPDTQAGTALLHACVRSGKVDMAQSVFNELFDSLLRPDEVTFSIMVRGYGVCSPPRWSAISTLLRDMDTKYELKPSTAVFNCLLEVCARTNDQERGYNIIEQMEKAGCEPDEYTLEAVAKRKVLRSHLRRVFTESEDTGQGY